MIEDPKNIDGEDAFQIMYLRHEIGFHVSHRNRNTHSKGRSSTVTIEGSIETRESSTGILEAATEGVLDGCSFRFSIFVVYTLLSICHWRRCDDVLRSSLRHVIGFPQGIRLLGITSIPGYIYVGKGRKWIPLESVVINQI